MRLTFYFTICLYFLGSSLWAQDEPPTAISYNEELASRLGGDKHGMKAYYMALLKPGTNRSQSDAEAAEIQKGHMQHIMQMAESGKLVLAGPFLEASDFRGIFIFDVATREEAEALTQSDPAVKSGRLEMVLIKWYGSAALKEVNAIHAQIQKKSISN